MGRSTRALISWDGSEDKDDQSLGRVETLMVDLPTARIVYVIISFDGTEKSITPCRRKR